MRDIREILAVAAANATPAPAPLRDRLLAEPGYAHAVPSHSNHVARLAIQVFPTRGVDPTMRRQPAISGRAAWPVPAPSPP